jgi:antitoxin (DNA-binding transcriptional repressor) of toxin-antitoxin stability system
MGKMVGAAEFKARCLRIMEEASRTGETVFITKRGKPFMEMKPVQSEKRKPLFGLLKNDAYRFENPEAPAYDRPWNAELGILGGED